MNKLIDFFSQKASNKSAILKPGGKSELNLAICNRLSYKYINHATIVCQEKSQSQLLLNNPSVARGRFLVFPISHADYINKHHNIESVKYAG